MSSAIDVLPIRWSTDTSRASAILATTSTEGLISAAHELAHGIFSLEHTFPQIEQGTTPNLLDYAGGVHLTQKQWFYIHSPLPAFSFLDDEEGGEYQLENIDYKCIDASISKLTDIEYYIDLDGQIIKLGTDYVPYAFVGNSPGIEYQYGRLAAIKRLSDGEIFLPKKANGENRTGYFSSYNGIYEEFIYEPISEGEIAIPLQVNISDICEYQILREQNLISSSSIDDCESCIVSINEIAENNSNSYFNLYEPNFYTNDFENEQQYQDAYDYAVEIAVSLVNNGITHITTDYQSDPSTKIHFVNFSTYSSGTTEGIAGTKSSILDSIELKLQDLFRTTYDLDKPVYFIVLFQNINFTMPNWKWNNYADEVLNQSELKNYDNVIFITLPFAQPLLFNGPNYQTPYFMPGLSFTNPNSVNIDLLKQRKYDAENFEVFVDDVYKAAYKPYVSHSYVVDLYGNVQFSKLWSKEWRTGLNYVNSIYFVYDENFDDYDYSLGIEHDMNSQYNQNGNYYSNQQNANFMASFREKEWAYESGDYTPVWVRPPTNIKHFHIRQFHGKYVMHYIISEFNEFRIEYDHTDPGAIPEYAQIAPENNDPLLDLIDFFSLVTSPIGGDALFDAIGLIYVQISDPANGFELSTRYISAALPLITGGSIRAGVEGIETVSINSLKQFGKKNLGALQWIDDELIGWTPELKTLLRNDLQNHPQIFNALENTKAAEAWKFIREAIPNQNGTTQFALDPKTLERVMLMLDEGSTFRKAFPVDYSSKLTELLSSNRDLRCNVCGNMTSTNSLLKRLPSMDEFLDNVEYISQFKNTPGFSTVYTNLISNDNNRDGINHMIGYMRNNQSEFTNLVEFEFQYSDEYLNKADALVGDVKYEFKSWTPGASNPWNSFFSGIENSYTQFLRYLENTNSLDNLRYVFNGTKVTEQEILAAFQDLFEIKTSEIFEVVWSNQSLRNDLFGNMDEVEEAYSLFSVLISDTDSKLYSFVILS